MRTSWRVPPTYRSATNGGGKATVAVLDERSEEVVLQRVDDADAIGRPAEVGCFYVEAEYDARIAEQDHLWEAQGESAEGGARQADLSAARQSYAAQVGRARISAQQRRESEAWQRYQRYLTILGGYTRRPPGEKWLYYARMSGLLLGDIAAIATAALLLGATPAMSVLQALANAVAAVTAGYLGHELRDSRLARRRQKPADQLGEGEREFEHLFRGRDAGERIAAWVVAAGLLTGALVIPLSVGALRWATEGPIVGLTFAALAAAVSLGSWANVYCYTDEVADLIETRQREWKREDKQLDKLRRDRHVAEYETARAEAASIRKEHKKRGDAAAQVRKAQKWLILRQNPHVAGHGWPVPPPSADHEPAAPADVRNNGTRQTDRTGAKAGP